MPRSRLALVLSCSLPLIACEEPQPAPEAGPDPAPGDAPEIKEVARVIDGDAPTVPKVYGALKIGMSGAEAKAVFPAMPENDTLRSDEFPGTIFYVDFDRETHTLRRFFFAIPGEHVREKIEKSWGPAVTVKRAGRIQFVWFNPDEGLRATLAPGFDSMELELTGYVPYVEMLEPDPTGFAFTHDRAILGATITELRTRFGDLLIERSSEAAAASQKRLAEVVGKADGTLPPPSASVYLDLPPTEWEDYWTRVDLMFGDDGRVRRYWLAIGFGVHPEAKSEIFDFLVERHGDPTTREDALGDRRFVFPAPAGLEIEAKEDTLGKAWSIDVSAASPSQASPGAGPEPTPAPGQ